MRDTFFTLFYLSHCHFLQYHARYFFLKNGPAKSREQSRHLSDRQYRQVYTQHFSKFTKKISALLGKILFKMRLQGKNENNWYYRKVGISRNVFIMGQSKVGFYQNFARSSTFNLPTGQASDGLSPKKSSPGRARALQKSLSPSLDGPLIFTL